MTHNELLEAIDNKASYWHRNPLRAVVELHTPEHSIRGYRCNFDDEIYPCRNIQAIEKELS